jgi:hypothetical protein
MNLVHEVIHWVDTMKTAFCVALVCGLPLQAMAQTAACRSITNPDERLACYDQGRPAAGLKKKSAATATPSDQTPTIDLLKQENDRLEKKISKICRGC